MGVSISHDRWSLTVEPEFDVVVPIIVGAALAVLVAWALHLGVFG